MKTIVVPGEQVADKPVNSFGVYTYNNKTYSKQLGVLYSVEHIKVVPLTGKYMPKEGDQIIGLVIQEDLYGYILDIKSFRLPYIHKRSIKTELKVGDLVLCNVYFVNEIKEASIDILAKLETGMLFEVSSKKVPRIIGKHRSMISLLEKYLGSKIIVGANGYIFAKGGKLNILKDALKIINKYSYVDNLTEKMKVYLENIK